MRTQSEFDLSIGEAELVYEGFSFQNLNLDACKIDKSYQDLGGYKPLVDYLEDKYNKKVCITNGAKQAVHASLAYMRHLRYSNMNVIHPYWHVFQTTFNQYGFNISDSFEYKQNAFDFIVSPNNPNGQTYHDQPKNLSIHDAVYNLPYFTDYTVDFGDITIYSASKMLGMSSFRVGWIISNESGNRFFKDYVEEMTVGVSLPSQKMVFEAIKYADKCEAGKSFIKKTLRENKNKMLEALKPYGNFVYNTSIFLFGELYKPLPPEIKTAVYPNNYVRINCCVPSSKIDRVVDLLNQFNG